MDDLDQMLLLSFSFYDDLPLGNAIFALAKDDRFASLSYGLFLERVTRLCRQGYLVEMKGENGISTRIYRRKLVRLSLRRRTLLKIKKLIKKLSIFS